VQLNGAYVNKNKQRFICQLAIHGNSNKMLSYRTETVLQGVSLGQKWKTVTGRQYFTDIGL